MKNYKHTHTHTIYIYPKQMGNPSQLSYIRINKNIKDIASTFRTDPTKRSNTLQLFVDYCQRIGSVSLTNLWDQI